MSEKTKTELLALTQTLLDSVVAADWDTYSRLCDPSLTAFEPEARGQLVTGMDFHKFYFDHLPRRHAVNTTITAPHVRLIGDDVAVVSYVRLLQHMNPDGTPQTTRFEETRVWELNTDGWQNVHFHRS